MGLNGSWQPQSITGCDVGLLNMPKMMTNRTQENFIPPSDFQAIQDLSKQLEMLAMIQDFFAKHTTDAR